MEEWHELRKLTENVPLQITTIMQRDVPKATRTRAALPSPAQALKVIGDLQDRLLGFHMDSDGSG